MISELWEGSVDKGGKVSGAVGLLGELALSGSKVCFACRIIMEIGKTALITTMPLIN